MDRQKCILIYLLLALSGLIGCSDNPASSNIEVSYVYKQPPFLNDGIETGDLAAAGFDRAAIDNMFNLILLGAYENIHSVLIAKDGSLVVEDYFAGHTVFNEFKRFDRSTLHNMHSVTKSFASALFGMAIDQGKIRSTEDSLSAYFPGYANLLAGDKSQIRLKHVLTMTAGLDWDERTHPYEDPQNDHEQMYRSGNWIRYVLGKPLAHTPGSKFEYNSGLSITLGGILRNVSGMTVDRFAELTLFDALGIDQYGWQLAPDGTAQTGGGLSLRPRDMLKFGLLFLNEGAWQGHQVISKDWVRESTKLHVESFSANYGYQWWIERIDIQGTVVSGYSARGRGGQFIFVFPEHQLVAVFTGGNDNNKGSQPIEMVRRSILPAIL